MRFLDSGLDLLKQFEGCKLKAYKDLGGIWTIGYGSTWGVVEGMIITQDAAERRLQVDLEVTFNNVVRILSTDAKSKITDEQFTAFCCFAFNVRGWANSEQMRRINACDWSGAADHWLLYDHVLVNGVKTESNGLLNRRKAELALFISSITTQGEKGSTPRS